MMKALWNSVILIAIVSLSISFLSCNDNDEDKASPESFLYGTWIWQGDENEETYELTFYENGKGIWNYTNRDRIDDITYSFDAETSTITFIEYHESYQVIEREKDKLRILSLWDNEEEIWIKK